MAQRNDDGVLPNSVITRENSIQSSISTISLQVEENFSDNAREISTRTNSIPSIVSSLSNEVEKEIRTDFSSGSIKRKIENKVHPISISSTIVSNETEEGKDWGEKNGTGLIMYY